MRHSTICGLSAIALAFAVGCDDGDSAADGTGGAGGVAGDGVAGGGGAGAGGSGAGGDAEPTPTDAPPTLACNPVGAHCLLPWPSAVFTEPDPSTATGQRVVIDDVASFAGIAERLGGVTHDGFSPIGALVTSLPGGFDADALPADWEASLADEAPIRLLAFDAGWENRRRVPYRAQVRASETTDDMLLMVTPLEALPTGGHVVAILTDDLSDASGAAHAPGPATSALLAGTPPEDPELAMLWPWYQQVLAAAGDAVDPTRVVQLWDAPVRSQSGITADFEVMAQQTLTWLESNTVTIRVGQKGERDGRDQWAIQVDVPLYHPDRDAPLTRDTDGRPVADGMVTVGGFLMLPRNATPENPAIPVLFGHGISASAAIATTQMADVDLESGPYAMFMFDWDLHGSRGRGAADIIALSGSLNSLAFSAALLQSGVDTLVFARGVQGLDDIPERGDVLRDDAFFLLGQSMGSMVMLLAASVEPESPGVVLNVAGGGMSNILRDGEVMDLLGLREAVEETATDDPMETLPIDLSVEVLLAMSQLGLDLGDPLNFAPHIQRERLSGAPPEGPAVLVQQSIGDGVIPNYTTETLARYAALPLIEPALTAVPGLETASAPTGGAPRSGLTQFRTNSVAFNAHLAFSSKPVSDQALRFFDSFLDDDPENDGDIAYDCPGGDCDLVGQ